MSTPRYYCHTCKKDIIPLEELTCPTCKGDFVEEVEEDDTPPLPSSSSQSSSSPLPSQTSPPSQQQQQQQYHPFLFPFQPFPFQPFQPPQSNQSNQTNQTNQPNQSNQPPSMLSIAQMFNQVFRMNHQNNNNSPFFPTANVNTTNTNTTTPNTNNNPNNTNNTNNNTNNTNNNNGRSFTFRSGPFQVHAVHTNQPANLFGGFANMMPGMNMNGNPAMNMNDFMNILTNGNVNFTPLAGNPGDYVFGNNFENFLNQMFQNANQTGAPPAAKSAIDELNKGAINESHVENKTDCAICKEEFPLGAEYIEMPCKHIFDKECILQWLGIHNSCPVCRLELKTDNPDYESRRQSQR